MRAAEGSRFFGRDIRRIHCVGVGGMGLGPLAIYLAKSGLAVTGEDDALGAEMREQLARGGVALAPVPADCDLIVHSSAIAAGHPALAAARGTPTARRGEMLAEIARGKRLVAVCGSHGKTTTTAMLIAALRRAGFPAGYVLGGLFADDTPPAEVGANDWLVAEIDESDGTIGGFSPEIAVVVNLDWDHPDFYRKPEDLDEAFAGLFARTRGLILANAACTTTARALARGPRPAAEIATFGRDGDFPGEIATEEGERMTLRLGGRHVMGEAKVRARGEFNASNATAALAAAQAMGAAVAPGLLADFPGVRRRQTARPAASGLTVIEDYAHHPAEIRALLGSLRRRVEGTGRLIVAFQPHRFSRTAQFRGEFAAALAAADRLHLLDVYPAGEKPVAGGATADLLAEVRRSAPALAVEHFAGTDDSGLFRALSREARRGDLVAFVGAGDIEQKARAWAAESRAEEWSAHAAALQAMVGAGTRLRREEPLAPKTTMRVGGAARLYAEPASVADLQALLRGARARGLRVFALGRGSNLIVPDEGVDGLVISLVHEAWASFEPRPEGRVWAGAGLRLKNLCGLAAAAGLRGFEFLEGIPGSVGGALRMNAGAMGGWMFDIVEEVLMVTPEGELRTLPKAAMRVEYRHCAELDEAIALGALLRPASPADTESINRQIDTYRRKRHETQPREPSAGCVFKNPPGNSAGRLIDECGLKGERAGDAEVSTVHANFIVNRGRATGADVLELVRRVRARVREAKGIELEPEAILYGGKWEEHL